MPLKGMKNKISSMKSKSKTDTKRSAPLLKALRTKFKKTDETSTSPRSSIQIDPIIEQEEKEIKRLSVLLGIEKVKSKKSVAAKLNKEYSQFEGMGEDFGNFLLELDDLNDRIENNKPADRMQSSETIKEESISENNEITFEENDHEDVLSENEDNSTEQDELSIVNDEKFTYTPAKGEDIYGRVVDNNKTNGSSKYIPPAKRTKIMINEDSESFQLLRRQINGLMNKLSNQSKDTIIRSIKTLFDQNSLSICTSILIECIKATCVHPSQIMSGLIPTYAALMAGLHFTIGIDIGAMLVENLVTSLQDTLKESRKGSYLGTDESSFVKNKQACNLLLLIIYLYNLRVVHHTLTLDILKSLLQCDGQQLLGRDEAVDEDIPLSERDIELIEIMIVHGGHCLRSDDPNSLKEIIIYLKQQLVNNLSNSNSNEIDQNNRVRFMLEALTELKNNKAKRVQVEHADVVKDLRKWLGSIKVSMGAKSGELCLRVSLEDLLNVEQHGRWWRAGASWIGRSDHNAEKLIQHDDDPDRKKSGVQSITHENTIKKTKEEEMLLLLATKMKMNTSDRRNIFVVLMSSHDVSDAFERINRLDLHGKQDREIVRVLVECCAQESKYNPFYAELGKVFCSYNRQFKSTFQYTIWDTFKVIKDSRLELSDGNDKNSSALRSRINNTACLLSHLICSFCLPLAVLKPVDMMDLNPGQILFFTTLFLAIFTNTISDDDFRTILDRVATTKDYASIRDGTIYFLQATHALVVIYLAFLIIVTRRLILM